MTVLLKVQGWFQKKAIFEASHLIKQEINSFLSQKNFIEAEKSLNRLIGISPNEEEGWVNLAKVQLQLKKLDEGYTALQRAIELNPKNVMMILNFVKEYKSVGKRKQSSNILYSAIQKSPDMLDLRLYLAQQFFEENQLEKAELELKETLNRDPNHLEALIGLTHCYIGLGHKQEALSQIDKVRQWDEKRSNELMSLVYENVQNFN